MPSKSAVNKRNCTGKLTVKYPHVGLFDARKGDVWIAKKRMGGISPVQISHASLLAGGTNDTSTVSKDQFICFWLHIPGSGQGYVQGYPIEWEEGHLMIRLDPSWDYLNQAFIPKTETKKIEANIDRQYAWGEKLYQSYLSLKPDYPLSWHMTGPRPADSMFYIERTEPN